MQKLHDLYEVTFNNVTKMNEGNIVFHDQNKNLNIFLVDRLTIQVAEPYLLPLSKYGGGFKTKTLVSKCSTWCGSITEKLDGASITRTSQPYKMVEI